MSRYAPGYTGPMSPAGPRTPSRVRGRPVPQAVDPKRGPAKRSGKR